MDNTIFYGDIQCQAVTKSTGRRCTNKAYMHSRASSLYTCKVHRNKEDSVMLKRRPKEECERIKQDRNDRDNKLAEEQATSNRAQGVSGKISLYRMGMMKAVPSIPGYVKVFPNNKHQNRRDGYGCSALSPMRLGPVEHNQPGLPPSLTVEGFHQGSKCYPEEVDDAGNPSPLFYKAQLEQFKTDRPLRRKYKGRPEYFVWLSSMRGQHKLDYIESRQFYCNFYERLARETTEFQYLQTMHTSGWNLCICGFDAFHIDMEGDVVAAFEEAYLDRSRPFGHERVLAAMLLIEDASQYPWRKHATLLPS